MVNKLRNNYKTNIIKEKYRHLFVIIESNNNNIVPASLEMLGEARRLMDHLI
jgi:hypothetical protein